jgi:hypothetical protein
MGDMMVMGLRVGLEEVDIKVNIGKVLDMVLVFIDSTLVIVMLVSGLMVKAMVLVFNLVLMVALTLVSLDLVLSMVLVLTISGMYLS